MLIRGQFISSGVDLVIFLSDVNPKCAFVFLVASSFGFVGAEHLIFLVFIISPGLELTSQFAGLS